MELSGAYGSDKRGLYKQAAGRERNVLFPEEIK